MDGIPVGLIDLLDIDSKNNKAEYYITIGNRGYLGKGIAYKASNLLLEYAFDHLKLNRVFLYTEYDNKAAQRLFEKIGFKREGLVKDDLYCRGKYVSRYLYGICKNDFIEKIETPIVYLGDRLDNQIYIKRDDLFPFSFGGNKARKGMLFWKDMKKQRADCYEEIRKYEKGKNIEFDYIFHASGTGTTQAGLVCGKILHGDEKNIVGISIARKNPYGRNVVKESIKEYLGDKATDEEIENNLFFEDSYTSEGYETTNKGISDIIRTVMNKYGIPLDITYMGKAFWGMKRYLEENKVKDKKVLFIHTGGTPLYFDDLGDL